MDNRNFNIFPNKEGATAIEFALVAPVLVLFTIGIVETSMMMLAQNLMESATFVSSRLGKTGHAEEGMSREETIVDTLNEVAGSLLDTNEIGIESRAYEQFSDIGDTEPFVDANSNGVRDVGENYTDSNGNGQYDEDIGEVGEGEAGQIVVYTVTYPWPLFTPIMSHIIGDEGIFNLTARTVVRNEPF